MSEANDLEQPEDPINTLLGTLAKLRLEIADVKSRQITSNQLDEFYVIMKETSYD